MADYTNLIKVLGHLKMAENLLETASLSDKSIYNVVDLGRLEMLAKEVSDYMAMNVDLDYRPIAQNRAESPRICEETPSKPTPRAKLTEDDVRTIIGLLHNGCKQADIARRFNVNPSCINKIATGETWRQVKRPFNFKVHGTINFAA